MENGFPAENLIIRIRIIKDDGRIEIQSDRKFSVLKIIVLIRRLKGVKFLSLL